VRLKQEEDKVMKHKGLICLFVFFVSALGWSWAWAKSNGPQFPQDMTFTTLKDAANPDTSMLLPFAIEGLTGDASGNLYTTGRQLDTAKKCPVWKISLSGLNATRTTVGFIPNSPACNPSGITFDGVGNLFIADAASGGIVRKVVPDPVGCASDDSTDPSCSAIPNSSNYATNVPGTNGLAFDRNGNLWTGDGVTGLGRVWKITGANADCTLGAEINCAEVFRIQPMGATNVEIALSFGTGQTFGSGVTSVGSDRRTLPPGTIDATRMATNTGNSQPLVANGVAFNQKGELLVIDTARGALWKVNFDRHGNIDSDDIGCDDAFSPNTLCLKNIFVAHPILEGGDGIALDVAGNIWADANERNAVAVVNKNGDVFEIFRNPLNGTTHLRNAATNAADNNHILEFPTSPFLSGNRFCTAQSDGNRRDNSPRTDGEINAGSALANPDPGKRGKISCMTDPVTGNIIQLNIPGLPLPVH
jgi:hypothetical protein